MPKYGIDWDDRSFPVIEIYEAGKHLAPMSLEGAKNEIYEVVNREIDHWKDVSHRARKLKESDFEEE